MITPVPRQEKADLFYEAAGWAPYWGTSGTPKGRETLY